MQTVFRRLLYEEPTWLGGREFGFHGRIRFFSCFPRLLCVCPDKRPPPVFLLSGTVSLVFHFPPGQNHAVSREGAVVHAGLAAGKTVFSDLWARAVQATSQSALQRVEAHSHSLTSSVMLKRRHDFRLLGKQV